MTEHWDGTHPEDVIATNTEAEWQVLIEETSGFGRDSYRWQLTGARKADDREDARAIAFELARTYQPEHPMSPQGRRVFQIGDDTWLVQVPGATSEYHFRVSVARLVTMFDKKGKVLLEF